MGQNPRNLPTMDPHHSQQDPPIQPRKASVSQTLVHSGSSAVSGGSGSIRLPSSHVIEANLGEYIAARLLEYWKHGFTVPSSVILYSPESTRAWGNNSAEISFGSNIDYQITRLVPRPSFKQIPNLQFEALHQTEAKKLRGLGNEAIPEEHPPASREVPAESRQRIASLLMQSIPAKGFSGFMEIPKLNINVSGLHNSQALALPDMPKMAYHNHQALGDQIFMFGGIYTDKDVDLSHLGIPNDVDPARISVRLNCDLPPHIDRDLVMNPYMVPNPHFCSFQKNNGTATYLDSFTNNEHPLICGMTSCKVSKRQIFFFGGFSVDVVSTRYLSECDRWEVEKAITTNNSGYILDTFSMKFKRIEISSSDGTIVRGRIGNAIEANSRDEWQSLLDKSDIEDVFEGTATTRTNTSTGSGRFLPPIQENSHPNRAASPVMSQQAVAGVLAHQALPLQPQSSQKNDLSLSKEVSEVSAYESDPPTPISIPSLNILGKLYNNIKTDVDESPKHAGRAPLPSNAPKSKVSSVLLKSTKIFHRSHQKTTLSRNPSTKAYATASVESTPAPSTSPSVHLAPAPASASTPVPPTAPAPGTAGSHVSQSITSPIVSALSHPLNHMSSNPASSTATSIASASGSLVAPRPLSTASSYTKQVKQNRSNSMHSGSRPTSPVILPVFTYPIKHYISKLSSETPAGHYKPHLPLGLRGSSPPVKKTSLGSADVHPFSPSWSNSHQFHNKNSSRIEEDAVIDDDVDEDEDEDKVIEDSVSVYIFGGFVPSDALATKALSFIATDDLYKVVLTFRHDYDDFVTFNDQAIAYEVGKYAEDGNYSPGDLWPTPRGYFATVLIDVNSNIDGNCDIRFQQSNQPFDNTKTSSVPMSASNSGGSMKLSKSHSHTSLTDESVFGDEGSVGGEAYASLDSFTLGNSTKRPATPSTIATSKKLMKQADIYFNGKALLIQGGCNGDNETFSEFYLYVFETGKWQTMNTYVHDYFKHPIKPWEDDDLSQLTADKAVENPDLIDAELRACHHHALYYKDKLEDYIVFMGGLTNEYLRKTSRENPPLSLNGEYRFDVLRLARCQIASTNFHVSRVLVLNLQTQTWKFLRYYSDSVHFATEETSKVIYSNPSWINARLSTIGGCYYMHEKSIINAQGIILMTPEKSEDFEQLEKDFPAHGMLSGGNLSWTFPGL